MYHEYHELSFIMLKTSPLTAIKLIYLIYPEEKQIMVTKFEYKYENKYEYPWIQIGEQIWYNYSVPGYKYDANMVSLDTNMIQI